MIRGNKSMDVKLSNYKGEDLHILKNMLYTYAGEKFRDKKIV